MSSGAHFAFFETPLGDCGVAWRGDLVVATHLPEKGGAAAASRLAARASATEGTPPPVIQRAIDAMTGLLSGGQTDLSFIACDFGGIDAFSADVYAAARSVPAGKAVTYGAIAAELGDKQLARKVGTALGRNPFPIIVPCHRVMGADGKLTGFSAPGGIETKLKMLAIEGAEIGRAPSLFDDLPLAVKPPR